MNKADLDQILKRKGYSIEDNVKNTRKVAKLEPVVRNATLATPQTKEKDSRRFLVRVTSIRKRLLDEDNLAAKYHIDCCRYAGLIPNDNPEQTKIDIRQRKTIGKEAECTNVEIEEI